MLRADAKANVPHIFIDGNLDAVNIDAILQIEKELTPGDLISVVFLLYESPCVALERLTVFQRLTRDSGSGEKSLQLLYDWAQQAKSDPTWRQELLEALAICQVNNVIRKFGFRVPVIKKQYVPDNLQVSVHVNPMKKALYKLCENVTSRSLEKLQNTLKTYDIDTTEYKQCELVFLELMCSKFITVDECNGEQDFQIEKLAKIIDNFPELRKIAGELRLVAEKSNKDKNLDPVAGGSSTSNLGEVQKDDAEDYKFSANAFDDLYKIMDQLNLEETTNLKSDTKNYVDGAYPIRNSKRVGVCYIINQEDFHPSKHSIESKNVSTGILTKRLGSDKDKIKLEKTMESLNFEVISHRNLDHKKMMEFIKNIVQYRVHHDDSIFMLCILSHGVRGHVYAADSVLVKVEDIQKLLDDGFQDRNIYEIPKVMILQACQVNNEEPPLIMVADAPKRYYIRKSHFLVYWATAPELEAYRIEKEGSIFIQMLCSVIQKFASREHLYDIFTKVTDLVAKICTKLQRDQVPIFESTLRKKVYLKIPE